MNMGATKKLDELNFNESIETDKVIPGMGEIIGKNMTFVGKSYHFVGDNGVLQTLNLYADGFRIGDYEHDD